MPTRRSAAKPSKKNAPDAAPAETPPTPETGPEAAAPEQESAAGEPPAADQGSAPPAPFFPPLSHFDPPAVTMARRFADAASGVGERVLWFGLAHWIDRSLARQDDARALQRAHREEIVARERDEAQKRQETESRRFQLAMILSERLLARFVEKPRPEAAERAPSKRSRSASKPSPRRAAEKRKAVGKSKGKAASQAGK